MIGKMTDEEEDRIRWMALGAQIVTELGLLNRVLCHLAENQWPYEGPERLRHNADVEWFLGETKKNQELLNTIPPQGEIEPSL